MKKNVRYLVVVLVCIAVLVGAVLVLALTGGEEEAASSSAGSTSSTAVEALIDRPDTELKTMEVTNEEGGYIIHAEPEAASSGAESGAESSASSSSTVKMLYTVDGLKDDYANRSLVTAAVNDVLTLAPSRDLGEIGDLSEYGLDKPVAKVKATYTDGSTFSYWVGGESAGTDGARYICEEGSSTVYVATLGDFLYGSNIQFIRNDVLNVTSKDETASSEENLESGIRFTRIALSGSNYDEPIELVSDDDGSTIKMVKPRAAGTNETEMDTLKEALTTLTAYGAAAAEPTQEDLEKYGLADPAARVEFTAEGDDYAMIASNADSEGYCYLMLEGRDVVYKVLESRISAWLNADAFKLQSRLTFQPMLTELKSMEVSVNGKETAFTFTRTKNEDKSTEDETAYDYTVAGPDGKELNYEYFRNFYKSFIVLSLIENTADIPDGDPEITATYRYFDKSDVDVVEFYRASGRRYTVVVNGQVLGNTVTSGMETALESMELLIQGEEVPDTVG
ncbi:DUF4340 domain-containing protein [Hydrogeniiclostridium mannosilyticum]|uniref:DUF4340 domain-containing protein n=1 Tax=Hydrogeniiclostridium mannosilyticum TaxID=2764322 RepID=UPI003999E17C